MADGPLTHDRDLSKFRDAYGIKDADWPDHSSIASRLRMGVALDDVTHLTYPVPVPVNYYRLRQPLVAMEFSCAVIQPISGRGLYLTSLVALSAGTNLSTIAPTVYSTLAQIDVGIEADPSQPGTVRVERGSSTLVMPIATRILTSANVPWDGTPLLIPFGHELWVQQTTVATALDAWVAIQEIP